MFDIFDVIAFVVFAVLLAALVVAVVVLGSLPGWIAQKRGHPQAAAIFAAGWLALLLPALWPLALIWAFLKPRAATVEVRETPPAAAPQSAAPLTRTQARADAPEGARAERRGTKEVAP